MDCIALGLKEAESQCHLEVLRFKPITLRAGLHTQQRKACLAKHAHSLIKTAKGEDQRRKLNFMQISMLRLKVTRTAITILTVPRGTTSHARCCSSTTQFSHKGGPRKSHCYTLSLYLCFFYLTSFSWGRCHLHPLTENRTELPWFCLRLEAFHCHPFKSESKKYASAWVNTTSFPTKLPGSFRTFLVPWLLVEQSDTKDRKHLKLKI